MSIRTTREPRKSGGGRTLATIRLLLLVLVLLGCVGFFSELVLLEHTGSLSQWIPLVLLVLGLGAGVVMALWPSRPTVRTFQLMMVLFIAAGLLGLYLHYQGNVEFELEMDASSAGLELMWQSLRGATPALAPGALVQLGLLGLIQTYRHPSLSSRGT